MLTEKEKKLLARYESQLKMPKKKFVSAYGLMWTIVILLVITPLEMISQHLSFQQIINKAPLVRFGLALVLGMLFGIWFWNFISLKAQRLRLRDN